MNFFFFLFAFLIFFFLILEDIISCVRFNPTGEYLATGDKGGRVVVFKRIPNSPNPSYDLYSTFLSHEREFDYLKSIEIDEKINSIRWLPQVNFNRFLISANDKTIKLWKLSEKDKKYCESERRLSGDLKFPKSAKVPRYVEASPKRLYENGHSFNINSLAVNNDQQTFLSSDDLRINLWNLEVTNETFSILFSLPLYFLRLQTIRQKKKKKETISHQVISHLFLSLFFNPLFQPIRINLNREKKALT